MHKPGTWEVTKVHGLPRCSILELLPFLSEISPQLAPQLLHSNVPIPLPPWLSAPIISLPEGEGCGSLCPSLRPSLQKDLGAGSRPITIQWQHLQASSQPATFTSLQIPHWRRGHVICWCPPTQDKLQEALRVSNPCWPYPYLISCLSDSQTGPLPTAFQQGYTCRLSILSSHTASQRGATATSALSTLVRLPCQLVLNLNSTTYQHNRLQVL